MIAMGKTLAANSTLPHPNERGAQLPPDSPVFFSTGISMSMCETQVLVMLAKNREWLAAQPDMAHWKDGCSRLMGLRDGRLQTYSADVCTTSVSRSQKDWPSYLNRQWLCFGYHWRDAIRASKDKAVQYAI